MADEYGVAKEATGESRLADTMELGKSLGSNIKNIEGGFDFLGKIFCSPISIPIGMIHSIFPMSICNPSGVSESSEGGVSYSSSRTPTSVIGDSNSSEIEGKGIISKIKQGITITRINEALTKFSQTSRINISAAQTADIHCPSDLLDKNYHMRQMADVKPKGSDIWKPAMVNVKKCSDGEKLSFVDANGNPRNDSCDLMEWEDGTVTDKGGYIVTYYDGTEEKGVREYNASGVRTIRWIYGCCPVADQKVQVKITQIDQKNEELINTITNEIDTLNKTSAEMLGCPIQQISANTTITQEQRLNMVSLVQQEIKQANDQTIIAAQNIKYTDYYQMCFKGEPRELKQEIDTRVLSVNIIDSAIKFSMDNKVSLKATASVSVVYESKTPRIYILSFLFNLIILGISFILIKKLINRLAG